MSRPLQNSKDRAMLRRLNSTVRRLWRKGMAFIYTVIVLDVGLESAPQDRYRDSAGEGILLNKRVTL